MPSRIVHHGDGVSWLAHAALPPDHALVTSLPDSSELRLDFDAWQQWFIDTAALACRQVADDAVTIFFQTDVKHDGVWIDKSHLLAIGADSAGAALLWHKIVCRAPVGTATFGRPGYAHLVCFSKALRLSTKQSSADVLPQLGEMPWPRATGVDACVAICRFLLDHTACRTLVDPFCGVGTLLAVANAHGLDAIGVERSPKRAARARIFELT